MRTTLVTLVLAAALSVFGCSSDGGSGGSGGSPGSGGGPGTGGSPGTGGTPGTGGAAGTGGDPGTGGNPGTGGTPASPGFESCSADSPGDACKCDPFNPDSCAVDEKCTVWFRDSAAGLQVIALDGSDGRTATECEVGTGTPVGLACGVVGDGAGFFASSCDQNGVCVEGVCERTCNSATGTSFCPGQFDTCEFDFGNIDYGVCTGP